MADRLDGPPSSLVCILFPITSSIHSLPFLLRPSAMLARVVPPYSSFGDSFLSLTTRRTWLCARETRVSTHSKYDNNVLMVRECILLSIPEI